MIQHFFNFLSIEFAACSKPSSRNNHRKVLVQGRNNVTRVRVEPRPCDQGCRKNDFLFFWLFELITLAKPLLKYMMKRKYSKIRTINCSNIKVNYSITSTVASIRMATPGVEFRGVTLYDDRLKRAMF